MKKIFIGLSAVALACSSAFAGKTAEEIRIYLNPGHGSWGPNNRPMQTIDRGAYTGVDVDTTGFFESNTNLWKMYSVLDHLVEAGVPFDRNKNQTNENPARVGAALDLSQNIVMSHVKVGPYPYVSKDTDDQNNEYNRTLSEIAEEVDANNFDLFLSVHSNAATEGGTTNFPIFLFRGNDDETYSVPGTKDFAKKVWPQLYTNELHDFTSYSATNPNVRGDINFYGKESTSRPQYHGYLGVLKHGVMGFLAEGYFHTYQPARQKYMNNDMCRLEGQLYARGIIDYMGWKKETTGDIYGFVRDLHEKFSHTLYNALAKSDDQYKPINGAVVKLFKDGTEVASYTTDNEYNGIFAFTDLEPGTYTLSYSAEGYKPAFDEYLTPVTVTANTTSYVKTFLESESYVAPTITYVNYPDELEGNLAYNLADEYNMTAEAEKTTLAAKVEGKTIRRQIVRAGKLYVLALDANNEPFVYIENLTTGEVTEVSTTGTVLGNNRTIKLSDIALTAEGVLVGSSYGKNQYSEGQVDAGDVRGSVAIYKWEKDATTGLPTGNAAVWFESQNSGNFYRAWTGQTIAYSGTLDDGAVMITAETTGTAKSLRFVEFAISDASLVSTTFINKDVSASSNYTATKLGTDYQLVVSPNATNQYIVDGSATTPLEWQTAAQNVDAPLLGTMPTELMANNENGVSCFKYAGRSLMVTPMMTDGKATGVKLFDITDGFANAKLIATNGTTVDAVDNTFVSAAGEVVVTRDDTDAITAADINLYLVRDTKVTKFTTAGTEQPKVRGQFAYNVRKEIAELQTTFYYTLADKAESAKLVIRDKDGNVVKEEAGSAAEGENSIVINNMDIADSTAPYSWYIDVENTIPTAMKVFSDTEVGYAKGVVVDTKPGSPNFGTVYVSNPVAGTKVKGLWKYDQQYNATNLFSGETFTSTNKSSPFRLGMLNDGSVLAADWSDALAGIWVYNPADQSMSQMFQGTKDSKGTYTNNGVAIGGGTTCASITGIGADTKLLTFCEDYPTGNAGQTLVMYNIGDNRTIATAPDATFPKASAKLNLNTNVEVRARENGFWASQSRNAGNNMAGVPSLIYCDYNDNIIFNSGSDLAELNGSNGAGFAVTEDNKYLAITNGDANIEVYALAWDNNVPSFSKLYTLTVGKGAISEMAFDAARNLYVAAQTEFSVWALPGITGKASTFGDTFIFDPESGVEATVADSKLVVYPNPANDVVNVKNGAAIESIALYSMSGAQVNAQPVVEGNNATLNVSGLASGVYMLKVNDQAVRLIKK